MNESNDIIDEIKQNFSDETEEIKYDEIKEIKYDENGMPIYDEDEDEIELRQIIYEKLKNKNQNEYDYNFYDKIKENKQKENKQTKTLSLIQFNEIISKKIEENKPKKFISKRCSEKKQEKPQNNIKIIKRTFNPRMVPYYFSDQYKNNNNNKNQKINIFEDFPLLS
jgi:hypothetical protein